MFTCGQCNAKQIKSFTKNAYHKGVVLARCVGCDKVHLVADNLGWFEDQPTNVETLHEGKVQKVRDHAAINAFLQKAFSEEETILH
jgi:protein import protein ZIM17